MVLTTLHSFINNIKHFRLSEDLPVPVLSALYIEAKMVTGISRGPRSLGENFNSWSWGCDNCGIHAAMSINITEHCPGCQHLRCEYCPVEMVKFRTKAARTGATRRSEKASVPHRKSIVQRQPYLSNISGEENKVNPYSRLVISVEFER